MKNWINLSRPRFWIYVLGPFLLTFATVNTIDQINFSLILMFVYFSFPANILIYGVNDIYDKATDILNAKKSGYENTLPDSKEEESKLLL